MAGKSREELKRSRSKDCRRSGTTTFPSVKKPRVDLYVELRILLPNKMAGAIIGRRGENIKRLRRSFLANINLPTCKGPERILTITAELCVTCDILADIIPTISKELNGIFVDDSELRILLHTRQAGAVIGRKGNTVKELRETTESKIKVFTESCPDSDDQVVQVRGTTRAIIRCIRGIFRTIENVHPPGANRRYYDPNNFDSQSASRYGGYDNKESLTNRTQTKPTREKSPDHKRETSRSLSTASDENANISSFTSHTKSSSASAPTPITEVPSLLSFISENARSKTNPDSTPNATNAGESEHCVIDNCTSVIGSPRNDGLSSHRVHSGSQSPKFISDWGQSSGRAETVSRLHVGAAPLLDLGASVGLQSNRSTRACLDRLLSAVSCLVSSTLPSADTAVRTNSVANGSVNRMKLSVANNNDRSTKPVMTSQIGIPHELVGTVFGKGNCRLKFMETMTSTKIWTDDVTDKSSDYVINVTGSPEQINCALELIQSVVTKHTRGRRQLNS